MTTNGRQIATEAKSSNHRRHDDAQRPVVDRVLGPLRTSVGDFAFRLAPSGCYLEIMVGHVRRRLGHYGTSDEAFHALKDRRTGFRAWDALGGETAVTQTSALKRWAKNKQTN